MRDAVWVQPDHQCGGDDGGNQANKHDETSVVPAVTEVTTAKYCDDTDDTTGDVQYELGKC